MTTPKFKSKLEEKVAVILGTSAEYEPDVLEYLQPEKKRRYIPDFKTLSNIYVECKGKWTYDDRQKHVLIREQHPDKRIIIIFQNPDVKLNKKSKTTYGDWASKNNIEWYDFRNLDLPKEIFSENKKRSVETPEGTLEFEGSLSNEELSFVVELGLNILMARGAVPFIQETTGEPPVLQ